VLVTCAIAGVLQVENNNDVINNSVLAKSIVMQCFFANAARVNTGARCTAVNTARTRVPFLETREDGPLRSIAAIVNVLAKRLQ